MVIGNIIEILDDIDYSISNTGTVRLIEKDDSAQDLYWLYIRANDEELNIIPDPRIGLFWKMIESNSNKIIGVYPPTSY